MRDGEKERQREIPLQRRAVAPQRRGEVLPRCFRRHPCQHRALHPRRHSTPPEAAFALGRGEPRLGQHSRQAAPGGAVGRPGEVFRPVLEPQPHAGQEAQPFRLGRHMGAHHAGEGIAVRDTHRRMAERLRHAHDLMRMGRALQEGEVRHRAEFGMSCHGRCPCSTQRGSSPGSASPTRQTQRRAPEASSTR